MALAANSLCGFMFNKIFVQVYGVCLLAKLLCVRDRISAKLFLWFLGVEFYSALQSGTR